IQEAQAFIGFRTKRDPALPGQDGCNSHTWVSQEFVHARKKILTVEVREHGVEAYGMLSDLVPIPYFPDQRDHCLASLVRLLGQWRQLMPVQVKLLPQSFVDEIKPQIGVAGLQCTYRYLDGLNESEPILTPIRRINGGLFIFVRNLPRNALVAVEVVASGKVW